MVGSWVADLGVAVRVCRGARARLGMGVEEFSVDFAGMVVIVSVVPRWRWPPEQGERLVSGGEAGKHTGGAAAFRGSVQIPVDLTEFVNHTFYGFHPNACSLIVRAVCAALCAVRVNEGLEKRSGGFGLLGVLKSGLDGLPGTARSQRIHSSGHP